MHKTKGSCGEKSGSKSACGSGYGNGAGVILWFIFIAFIIFFIIVAVRPDFVRKCDSNGNTVNSVDIARAVGWSILIAFVICIIFWALWKFADMRGNSY